MKQSTKGFWVGALFCILFFLLFFALAYPAMGQHPSVVTDSQGNVYTWRDGYYWWNGRAYNRTQQYFNATVYNGCYTPASYYWVYREVHVSQQVQQMPYVPPQPPEDWRTQLLKIAAARDHNESLIRKGQIEQQYFSEAVRALGIQPTQQLQQQMNPGFPYQLSGTYNYGSNASTQYGYSQIAHLYGDTNLNQLFLQNAQLVQNLQKLTGEATTNFSGLVGQEGGNRAKVAEILARGQVAMQVLQSLSSPEMKSFSFTVSPVTGAIQKNDSNVEPDLKARLFQQWGEHATAKCAMCHNGNKIEGKFDLNNYLSMSQQEKQDRVWSRLTHSDPTKRMPKNGPALTSEELRLWFVN